MATCLGGPFKRHNAHTLKLSRYVTAHMRTNLPPSVDVPIIPEDWGVLGNQTAGDCAAAAAGHAEQLWAAPNAPDPPITDPAVMGSFTAALATRPAGGIAPAAAGPPGLSIVDALDYWRDPGIAGHRIDTYAEIPDVKDPNWMKLAISFFGCVYARLSLPDAVVPHGMTPDTAPAWDGDKGPLNMQNDHCVIYAGYEADMTLTAITWGLTMPTAWDFHTQYCDEGYVALSPEWQKVPAGVKVAKWKQDSGDVAADGAQAVAAIDA
jgi:hypothetical protein